MPIEITMPALSPTMEEGNLAKWLVKEGDSVAPGDVIAEIETDKATMEVEAVDEGTMAKILIEAGTEGVKVNAVIGILAEEGEDVSQAASAIPEVKADTPKPDDKPSEKSEQKRSADQEAKPIADAKKKTPAKGGRVFATPLARRIAEQKGIDLSSISGSGPHGRVIKSDVENAKPGTSSKSASKSAAMASGKSWAFIRKMNMNFYHMMECAEPLRHD
jgi:pyruvate dehydrogenase E2 component (dihydrolipoamide acetyltransferase)